jgi:hypothetical protein
MNKIIYSCILLLSFFSVGPEVYAQPANDNCNNAIEIPIPNNGYGLGTVVGTSVDITNATIQVGETFAPSIFVAAQNQKSVWYKFRLASSRKVTVRLKQGSNTILNGDLALPYISKIAVCQRTLC